MYKPLAIFLVIVLLLFLGLEAIRFIVLGELDDEDSESFKANERDDNETYKSGMIKILWSSGHPDVKFSRDYKIKRYRKGGKYEKYAELL